MASTAAYGKRSDVKAKLPRDYSSVDLPDSSDATYTSIDTHLIRKSRVVDAALGQYFVTFNAYDHTTYPTPAAVLEITTDLTLGDCYEQLAVGDRDEFYGSQAEMYKKKGEDALDWLAGKDRDGNPRDWIIANESVASETLIFGDGSEYQLSTNEAFINVQANLTSLEIPTILRETVKVLSTGLTGYKLYHDQWGGDFDIVFDVRFRKWKLIDLRGALKDAAAKTISYDFSLKRYVGRQDKTDSLPTLIGGS